MPVEKLPLRKKLGLGLHNKQRSILTQTHTLNYLMWECTLRCNLSCGHCGSDCRTDSTVRDMPAADFLKVLDGIVPHVDTHKTMIVLTGGEPLMRHDLEYCGREFYRREFPWGMVTNGLALSEKRLDGLLDSGLRSVTVSLDGPQEVHNRLRGNPRSFQCAMNAIKALAARDGQLVYDVVTTVTGDSLPHLPAMKQMLIEAGVRAWRIFTVFPIGRAADNPGLQLPAAQFREVFEFIRRERARGDIDISYGCEGFLGNYESDVRDGFFFCRAGVNVGSVLADGSISACPNLRANFIQGNIYEDDFMEVWNNRFRPHRDRLWAREGECADCKWFRHCLGNGLHLRDNDGKLLFCHLKRLKEAENG